MLNNANINKTKITSSKEIRLSNIEILRFFSILLVVLHHVAIHTNWTEGLSTSFELLRYAMVLSGKVGVDLFIIISGYLMINSRAKLSSLLRTVSETIVFSLLMYLVTILLKVNGTVFSTPYFFKRLFPIIFSDYWFVTAFAFMYILLPILLPYLTKLTKKEYQFFLISGFGVVSIWPMIALNKGMNFSYVILFLYLFSVGGYIRKFNVKASKFVAINAILLITMSAIGLTYIIKMILQNPQNKLFQALSFMGWAGANSWRENIIIWFDASPFPLLIAVFLFVGTISVKQYYNKTVNFLGAHVFGAYLFQSAPIFSPWIYTTVINLNRVQGTMNRILLSILVAFIFVFIGILMHAMLVPMTNKLREMLLLVVEYFRQKLKMWDDTRSEFLKFMVVILLKFSFAILTAIFVVPDNKILGIIIITSILMIMMHLKSEEEIYKIQVVDWLTGLFGSILFIITLLPVEYFNSSLNSHVLLILVSFVTFSFTIANTLRRLRVESILTNNISSIYWKYLLLYSAVICVYFVAYYPGIMVMDSVNQWNQIHHSYPWNNWHPIGHTAILWLTSKIWNTPATFIILQSIVYVTLFAYLTTLLKQYLSKKWVGSIFFVLTAIVPFFPLQAMIVVKDTLFTYAFLFFGIALYQTIRTNGKWLHHPFSFVLTLIATLGVSLWRSNGAPIILVMLLLIIIILGFKNYWRLISIMLLSIGCYFVINGPIITKFHIFEPSKTESYGMLIQLDAGIIHNDGVLNVEQQQYFSNLMNSKNIAGYQPTNIDAIKFGSGFNSNLLNSDTSKFKKESISLIRNNKMRALEAYKAQTFVIWNQNAKYRKGSFMRDKYNPVSAGSFLTSNQIKKYDIEYQAFNYNSYRKGSSSLHKVIRNWQATFENQSMQHWFLPGIYLMVQITIAIWLVFRGLWHKLLVVLPIIGLAGTYMLAIPAPDIRYLQPILLYVFITILAANMSTNTEKFPWLQKLIRK